MQARHEAHVLGLIFVVLAAGIVTAGYFYCQSHEKHYRAEVKRELSAIAELKTHELADWREERLGDAHIFFKNATFSLLVRRFFDAPEDVDAREQIRAWLSQIHAAYQYDRVFLLDAKYSKKMTVPEAPERETSYVSERTSEILRSGEIAFEDFYRNEQNERIYLKVLVPILAGGSGSRLVAVVALRIDPATHLYLDLSRWPTPSQTAEALIVRRDGNDALFLNNPRFQKNAALNLRVSLEEGKDLPAVKAVMGQEGIVEGMDYRGVQVVAAVRAVSGSPWFLVARMDASEVYAPVKERLWLMVVLVGVLLLGTGAGVGLVWRQQSVRFYRKRSRTAEALAQSEKTLRVIFDGVRDGILIADARTLKFANANQAICRMLGYGRDEVLNLGVNDIHPQESLPSVLEQVRRQTAGEISLAPDLPVLRKDGSIFPADVNATLIELGGLPRLVGVFRDVTERKHMEHELRRLAVIAEQAAEGIALADLDGNLQFVNDAWARMHGYESGAELVGKHLRVFHTDEQLKTEVISFNEVVNQRGHNAGEMGHVRRDGTTFPAQMIVTLLKDEQGKPYGLAAFAEDITHRKRAEEELKTANQRFQALATTDELTGLCNRRRFLEILTTEVERSRRYSSNLALLMVDVDQFRIINDTYGHAFGDRVLVETAKLLRHEARQTDLVARYGGDEFMVLMPNTSTEEAVSAAERIRTKVGHRHISDGDRQVHLSVSAGIGAAGTQGAATPDGLVRAADEALYVAKHSGRNCTKVTGQIAHDTVAEKAIDSAAVETLRRQAITLSARSRMALVQGIYGLIHAHEARDPYAKAHSRNVTRFASRVASAMGLDPQQVETIRRAALIHDIGKIAVPDGILWKPGALTAEENLVMQQHVIVGVRILDQMRFLDREIPIVRHHHERYDGHGHPDGISGEAIPLGSRILAVADALDAITADRPHRQARTVAQALQVFIEESGRQFDPNVVDATVQWVHAVRQALGRPGDLDVADLLSEAGAEDNAALLATDPSPQGDRL